MKSISPVPRETTARFASNTVNKNQTFYLMLALLLTVWLAGKAIGQDQPTSPTTTLPAGEEMILKPVAPTDNTTTGAKTLEMAPPAGESTDRLRVTTLTPGGYLHYDEEKGSIYSPERTRIVYKEIQLTADTLDFNTQINEITAVGNVILKRGDTEVYAERIRYNFDTDEGVAFKPHGKQGNAFFSYNEKETDNQPTVQRLSKEEIIMRGASATGCDFVIPHYRVSAREIILYPDDHILFRGAIFYMREFPVMYLPFYTRSLKEKSPWFMVLGYKSRVGAFARLGYSYRHQTLVPSATNGDKMETQSNGLLRVFADVLTKRGVGTGATYDYMFDYGRHQGESEIYYMLDSDRQVED